MYIYYGLDIFVEYNMFFRGGYGTDPYVKSAGAMSEIARDRARRTRKLTMNNSVRYEGNFVCRKRKREREKDGQAAKQTETAATAVAVNRPREEVERLRRR